MKSKKVIPNGKILLCILGCLCFQIAVFGQTAVPDSIRTARTSEVNFIIKQIDSVYICGRRGLSDDEWNRRVQRLHQKVDSAKLGKEYLFALRYVGALISDSHFDFPDGGVYNRTFIFKKSDTIFPVWVRTWEDGAVYVVKDYTSKLPKNAQIISVNGHSAQQMALVNRSLAPKEESNAMVTMNLKHEADPRTWYNFTNFLFMDGIKPPYKIEYRAFGSDQIDTVTLQGITRDARFKTYKKSGDLLMVAKRLGGNLLHGKSIYYKRIAKSSAILNIDNFWGKSLIELFIFRKDWTYPRKLKNVMARIARHKIDTLIVDIARNGGGMADNIYKTLNYFTDKPVDANSTFHVTDNNREIMKTVMSNSPFEFFGLTKEQKAKLVSFVDSVRSGDSFSTDTLFDLKYRPDSILKHRYTGKVYLVTGNATYSAAQQFAQAFQTLGIGPVAGQPCGGYTNITGGNSMYVTLPYISRGFTFMVPYSKQRDLSERFEYMRVDIPIEITFDEWLRDENRTVPKLLNLIRTKN